MLERFATWLTETVFTLGYPGITILMAVESSAIPFPSEVVMPPAGYLAAKGRLSFPLVMVAGVAGSLIGALANYWAARWLERWLRRYGKWLLVSPSSLDRAEAFFRRHGEIGTFIGRLVPVVRQLISIPAGLARMRMDRFLAYTALGAGIWCLILTYIGYAIGQHEAVLRDEEVHRYVRRVLVYLLPSLAVIAGAYTVWYRRRHRGGGPSG
ncbi:MAG TPA: DedA family protein [Gemmatimonadales bacterium]|jgi:membrane protein DedA with SNARE-associated domain|nr:DedA family protein [Gemmatimonadales bacterium]